MHSVFWLIGILTVAGVLLWWLADHRRGIRWAQHVIRRWFPDVRAVSPAALNAWLSDVSRPQPQLLDARTPGEQAVSTLPGARCIDPDGTADSVLSGADRERPIVVYCAAGYRGARMARRLMQAGCAEVFNLDGGIFAWANEGFAVEKNGRVVDRVHPHSALFSRMLKHNSGSDP